MSVPASVCIPLLPQATPFLLVVAKAPIPGFAKTRLCPPATPRQAAHLAAASLLNTLDAACATGAPVVVALAGDVNDGVMATEVQRELRRVDVIAQRGNGLGERLSHAHADAARLHPGAPVLQIGMDTPQLTARELATAMTLLVTPNAASDTQNVVSDTRYVVSGIPDGVWHADDALAYPFDAVLGAATDGGWWALGLRDPGHADVLTGVSMSTSETGVRTRHALQARGLRTTHLLTLSDVDTMADACRIAPGLPGSRFAQVLDTILAVPAASERSERSA